MRARWRRAAPPRSLLRCSTTRTSSASSARGRPLAPPPPPPPPRRSECCAPIQAPLPRGRELRVLWGVFVHTHTASPKLGSPRLVNARGVHTLILPWRAVAVTREGEPAAVMLQCEAPGESGVVPYPDSERVLPQISQSPPSCLSYRTSDRSGAARNVCFLDVPKRDIDLAGQCFVQRRNTFRAAAAALVMACACVRARQPYWMRRMLARQSTPKLVYFFLSPSKLHA